ncbi:MAG: hypothetical protein ABI232_08425 [Jatrophihabitantaceae bacterium]
MELPTPQSAVLAFAAFVRSRLSGMGDTLSPLWSRPDGKQLTQSAEALANARQLASVIVGAAAPFAPTSYARARLLRQLHAGGMLTEREAEDAEQILGVAQ